MYEIANKIKDKRDFEKFLKLFYEDFLNNKDEWENIKLEDFLESLYACCSNTTEKELKEIPSWKLFADVLLTAKVYE